MALALLSAYMYNNIYLCGVWQRMVM